MNYKFVESHVTFPCYYRYDEHNFRFDVIQFRYNEI